MTTTPRAPIPAAALLARCRASLVDETAEAVTVTVVTDDPPGGSDCADGDMAVLAEPLGARELIDGSTGQEVEVGQFFEG